MKTLDEIVKSYEISTRNKDCSQCPYDGECYDHHVCECYERMEDTYHYLKEYQERLQNLQDMMDRYDISVKNYEEAVENCRIAEQKYWRMTNNVEDMNLPTWDELKHQEIVCPKCHSEFVILDDPDGDHAQLLKCQALLQDFYRNDPLTWDELKTMEGRPVWIEDGLENGEWYIIECFTESGRFIAHDRYADDTVFKVIDMGDMWKAYRKERS